MSEMVERVAMALATARAGPENAALSEFNRGNLWAECTRDARVAIEAMREPTERMVHAPLYDGELEHLNDEYIKIRDINGAGAYRAMIDAALKEPKP